MDSRQAMDLLNQQRAKRPSSPWHIYQPQLTSMSSIANRVTGTGLSVGKFLSHLSRRVPRLLGFAKGDELTPPLFWAIRAAFYGVFLGHVLAPAFGTTLDSASLVELFAALPGWFATSLKAAVAGATSYHTINGLRHLGWDMGYREFALRVRTLGQIVDCERQRTGSLASRVVMQRIGWTQTH